MIGRYAYACVQEDDDDRTNLGQTVTNELLTSTAISKVILTYSEPVVVEVDDGVGEG